MKIKTIVAGLSFSFLTACQAVFFSAYNTGVASDQYTTVKDIQFSNNPDLKLDIYQPAKQSESLPVMIFIYGGGWTSGEREWYRFVGAAFASAGYITIIPDYRKGDKVPFPGFMFDAAKAVAWTTENIGAYGGDANKLFVSGHSAGGQIAVLLATDPQYLQSVNVDTCQLRGVIGYAGAYDFLPLTSDRYRKVFGDKQNQQRSQPVNYASADAPPLLLIQGLRDNTVAPKNARNMAAAMDEAGGTVETKYYDDASHTDTLLALSERSRTKNTAFADTITFMQRRLAAEVPDCS